MKFYTMTNKCPIYVLRHVSIPKCDLRKKTEFLDNK